METNSFLGDDNIYLSRTVSATSSELEKHFREMQVNDNIFTDTSERSSEWGSVRSEILEESKVSNELDENDKIEDEIDTLKQLRNSSASPFIKTVVAERKITAYEKFNMNAWAELQDILKSNYFVIRNGNISHFFVESYWNK